MGTRINGGSRAPTLLAVLLCVWPALATAQEPAQDTAKTELERIRAAAAAAAGATGKAARDTVPEERQFVGRQRNQQALNPEITVTGDLFGSTDLDDPGEDAFSARGIEFSFQSALDPYASAKVIVGFHGVGGGEIVPFGEHEHDPVGGGGAEEAVEDGGHAHGTGGEVEEAYVQWHGLPGGLNVQLGRFRQNITPLNRWHAHALPGQSYPLPLVAFFGEEGLAQTGLGIHWLVPFTGFGTWEVWTDVTASGNEQLFGDAGSLSLMGRINAFWDLSASTYFELGAGGLIGPDRSGDKAFETAVATADFTLSWRPPARSRYREATLRGGVMVGEVEPGPAMDVDHALEAGAWGGFANAEYRLDQRWIVGGRAEYTENPLDPDETTWLAAPTLTWWQSEWVRLRLEFDYLDRPDGAMKLLVLQATFAMGPHKHETY